MAYNALLICSVSSSDSYLIDMFENSFSVKGFDYITIGKNPYIDIDLDYIKENVNKFDIIVIVITNSKYIDIIKQILEDNIIFFTIKKRPVIVVSTPDLIDLLRSKSTISVIVDRLFQYQLEEIKPQIEKLVEKIKDVIDKRKFQESLGTLGLILGGIGIGAGLLFYLFRDKDDDNE